MPKAAVITADIVNSTLLPRKQLNRLIKSVEAILRPHRYEFYRGDGIQVYVKDISLAFETGLKLRLAAKKIIDEGKPATDIRIAIGIGDIKTPVRTLKQSTEQAFILSGRGLDDLTRSRDRLRIVSNNETVNDLMRVISRFMDYLFTGLTSKQSEVILELMQGHTQTQAAKRLKKSQVTIHRQAHAAAWSEIEILLNEYKNAVTKYILS